MRPAGRPNPPHIARTLRPLGSPANSPVSEKRKVGRPQRHHRHKSGGTIRSSNNKAGWLKSGIFSLAPGKQADRLLDIRHPDPALASLAKTRNPMAEIAARGKTRSMPTRDDERSDSNLPPLRVRYYRLMKPNRVSTVEVFWPRSANLPREAQARGDITVRL